MALVATSAGLSWGAVILAGLSFLASFYVEYTHNDKATAQRVTALEVHQVDDNKKLEHIESQVDKLVDWALGKRP